MDNRENKINRIKNMIQFFGAIAFTGIGVNGYLVISTLAGSYV